jgi:outer membrane protein OmpA-like peptidoglycan-associated protein
MLFDLLWSAGVEFLSLNCRNSSNKTLIVRHPDLLEWMVIITKPPAVKARQHIRRKIMKRSRWVAIAFLAITSLATLLLLCGSVAAQAVKAEGLITGRSGATMTLQTADAPKLVVVLTDYTQVSQVQGVFKARRKQMSMAALVPGLQVQVEGTYNAQNQLVASSVKFKGNDLEQAQSIQAGLQPAKEQIQQSQEELAQQKAALEQQQQAMAQQQQEMAATQEKVAANKAAIAAANKRFGELGDYNILDEVTVYFANGKVTIDPKYKPQLQQLADKAKTITAYMIQVKGYASSVGSASLNQKLSEDRANNVTQFLQQQGHVPLTNMLAPGAMGESRQVGGDKTAEGQAENRRVVVRILQNKGIAGT